MLTPYPGPIPPYNNVPINPQYFQPSEFAISGITLGQTSTVTTILNMNYVIGQQVRLVIPQSFGCYQLNEATGYVIDIPAPNQVVLTIDSSKNVNPYQTSSSTTPAQILAIGDVNTGNTNNNGPDTQLTGISGSFMNISPL